MPLGVREILLVVRAQNSATGVLQGLAGSFRTLNQQQQAAANAQIKQGKALVAVGVGIAAVGAAGLAFMKSNTTAAVNYNKQVAYTKTQMQGVKGTFQQVAQAGIQVARQVPVPFDEIQGALYDIFSSMSVNMSQAKVLLTSFAKASVAGQVSLQDADRATIGIMNAYHLKASEVNKVNDEMFQLVAKGVGTYADFANSIGRAVPSAAKAGENFNQLAGMMAFLTRNGLSAAAASSAAARALDALGKVSEGKGIINMGSFIPNALNLSGKRAQEFSGRIVDLVNKAGNLKSVTTIMQELADSMKGLSQLQRSQVLNEMFKNNGGTIQAFRFLAPASSEAGAKQLAALTKDMENSGGAMSRAFKQMQNTPAEKIQQLKNNFKIMQVELGEALLPTLAAIVGAFSHLFGWIDKLSPGTLKIVGIILTVVSAVIFLTGVTIALTGAFMILAAVFTGVELLGLPIALALGLIVAGIIAVAVAAFFIIKYWGPISTWFHNMWFDMWHWIDNVWDNIFRDLKAVWTKISSFLRQWWYVIVLGIFTGGIGLIVGLIIKFHSDVTKVFLAAWGYILNYFKGVWAAFLEDLRIAAALLLVPWVTLWLLFRRPLTAFWNWLKPYVDAIWTFLKTGWNLLSEYIRAIWVVFWGWAKSNWQAFWNVLKTIWSIFWTTIKAALRTDFNILKSIWTTAQNALRTAWNSFWGGIKSVASAAWGFIVRGWNQEFWTPIKNAFRAGTKTLGQIWSSIKGPLVTPLNWVINHIYDDGIRKVWNTAAGIVSAPKLPFVSPLKFAQGAVVNRPTLGMFGEAGPEMILPLSKPKRMMELLQQVLPGFADGGIFGGITSAVKNIGSWIAKGAKNLGSLAFHPVEALLGDIPGGGTVKTLLKDMGGTLIKDFIKKLTGIGNTSALLPGGDIKAHGAGAAANQAAALLMLPAFGLARSQFTDLIKLWNQESGWNQYALNASSGAYGIPQSLPASKMASAGADWRTNPITQMRWGLNYIKGRYGSLAAAWAHEVAFNWYRNGGLIPAGGMGGVGEAGAEWARTLPNGRWGLVGTQGPQVIAGGKSGVQVAPAGGPTQQINVYTNEIDPRRHAAELGWELARRSG